MRLLSAGFRLARYYYRHGEDVLYADLQDMALMGPNTILVANVSRRDDA